MLNENKTASFIFMNKAKACVWLVDCINLGNDNEVVVERGQNLKQNLLIEVKYFRLEQHYRVAWNSAVEMKNARLKK